MKKVVRKFVILFVMLISLYFVSMNEVKADDLDDCDRFFAACLSICYYYGEPDPSCIDMCFREYYYCDLLMPD